MKSIWINIFAVVIALTSLTSEGTSVNFSSEQMSSLQSIPLWESDALKNPTEKQSEKNHVIAQDFFPIVIIASQFDSSDSFHFYLPLYNLHRQKEYFLLI
jgi:hypothetical protein